MDVIRYEEINNMLNNFKNLETDCSENSKNATNALKNFTESGLNLNNYDYASETISAMTKSSETLINDYERIITYLEKVAQKAKEAETKAITTLEAREIANTTRIFE